MSLRFLLPRLRELLGDAAVQLSGLERLRLLSHNRGVDYKLDMLYACYPTGERPRFAIYIHGTGIRPTSLNHQALV